MKRLLRIYLVLIFVGSAVNAGSENHPANVGFPAEESNFASDPAFNSNLEGIANCMNSSFMDELNKESTATGF
ncbi:hypothetical protein [Algoriphagus sp. NG3]|uniref:hypothetical protein n=1 Tax=unclassified Algoriphagus TaxID=2641541 RepID=UPI002A83A17A|nr:hypothetical protein [Algoriphagus sp. NG3]WPR73570.1 hypothetical protein SLW71_12865 [Algoriphagus sp. NG3]